MSKCPLPMPMPIKKEEKFQIMCRLALRARECIGCSAVVFLGMTAWVGGLGVAIEDGDVI